ncbi:MAG: argininosuccinate lyase, partial [Anaerolineae bacterium]|nr:argininosuccinate lyase [Anaerolineae bacterium]
MSLWGGRFSESADDSLRALNDSLRFDIRMVQEDIRGSQKYAKALAKAAVITDEECAMIRAGLDLVKQEF